MLGWYTDLKDAKHRKEYFKTTKGKTTLRTMKKEFFKEKGNSRRAG